MPCAMHWNALRCDVIQCICAHVYTCTVLGIFFKDTIAKGQDNVCCDILKNLKEKIAHPPNFPHHCVGNPNSKYQFRIATVEAYSKNIQKPFWEVPYPVLWVAHGFDEIRICFLAACGPTIIGHIVISHYHWLHHCIPILVVSCPHFRCIWSKKWLFVVDEHWKKTYGKSCFFCPSHSRYHSGKR